MADSAEFVNRSYQYENIQKDILAKLDKARRDFPERFSKPIHVLAAVDSNVDGQWERRLRQAKKDQTGERVTLIPYNSGDFHWIGVLLEFKANGQIERAEFIDPVKQSSFHPGKLQQQFDKVYSNVILRSRNLHKHDDPEQSTALIVEIFINAAEQVRSPRSDPSSRQQDKTLKFEQYEALKGQLDTGLAKHKLSDEKELEQRIMEEKQVIQSLEKDGKHNLVQKRENSLSELELLQSLVYEIKAKKSSLLTDGLAEDDINSNEELQQRILEKKQVIKSLKKEGKHNLVQKRQNSLSELEQPQLLVDEIDPKPVVEVIHMNIPIKEECLGTDENLRNMYKDLSSMPSCSERSIICLLFYTSLKLAGNTITLDHSIKVPGQIETKMSKELECLQERLKIEELDSVQIHDSVQAVRVNIKNENWKCVLTILRQILKQICPLDMQELLRLVEKTTDAAHLIKDKEIIFFLGGTGSGKSTTIHFLSGSKMVEQKVAGLNHIAPTEIKYPELKKITTAPFTQSETRYITPVTVNFKDVGAYTKGNIILCDSPGFEDTNGPEVDIANGISIVKAIKVCKSVKPVVLFSSMSIGDRYGGVKDLAHVLVGLIPEIKDHIKAFSYIFTKFSGRERNAIHANLKDLKNNLNEMEESDISFTTFLTDMLRKTGKGKGARVLDPINDAPGDILDELAESDAISYPEEVFQFSITEKSKTIVQEHVRKSQLSIMSATKRSEYLFVKYKLDQLKCLSELLGQDYIEQIYNDCVRYISKHLSEEYEEGIAAMNRFIMKQTILNIEDIQQYQTRIEHAKIAEELRNRHFGKEIIHSSAFIQNLNQQVDIILEGLRQRDIDDLSVKTSLDKIKLLSNSFPDLDYRKYEHAYQLFTEKFEFVIEAFKSSVLSNKFNKSANDISKLYQALTVLKDHLNSEYMNTKYLELKKYFLKYLNDSTEKLSHIFNQKQLTTNDVDNLNSCVCMLETANNTFNRQSYIFKETINEIYLNFSSKIVNYFQEIVKKINKEFENKNSFHVLEQLMIELDSIRTISNIALKTTESYFTTLGKLTGYINESRRDAEELIKALFRREGNVNYEKLVKCLSSLKSAKWIEKYQPGMCSDVVNSVEEQIIQHIKELKESVMEVNLDLDNFDKIEHTYKIISEINEMKVIEKIVPGVVSHINEVNSCFEEETNNVFSMIKDTFSIEKWKEQEYQMIDSNKAEKALCYLDVCKKIRILLKSDCMSVLVGLEEFIQGFSRFVQKEMTNCFETIKRYENNNKEEMFTNARILASHLHEISEIKVAYPRVFSCFTNKRVIEEWNDELSNYLIELSDEMEKLSITQRNEALSSKLLIVKALSKLDTFLKNEKYINVYNKYQSKFFSQNDNVCKQVIDAIKNNEYERVAFHMGALQSSTEVGEHFFNQAKQALNIGLANLMEETKTQAMMLGNNIEIEGIQPIVDNLKRMQRAKQFVSQYLDAQDGICTCIGEIKKLIEERIKRFLEGVKALININNFYEADKKIDSITLVRTLLGNYCTEDVVKEIEALKERQSKVVLVDVVDKYSEMDITGYTMHPPTDIFAKFGEVNNTNPIYSQALNTIKERIVAKFREELTQAKSEPSPNPENSHIRKFESAVKYLPDDMKSALEVELKHCKDDIVLLIQDNDMNLNDICSSGDLESIKNILRVYQKSRMQRDVNKVRTLVLKQIQEIALKINQHFERYEVREALDCVKKLYDYKVELESILIDIRQPYSDVRSRIKITFEEAHLGFTLRFFNIDNILTVTKETMDVVERSFICLIEFTRFANEHKDQPILNFMLPEDFNKKITAFSTNLLQYFIEQRKKYEDALEKLDVTSLRDFLKIVSLWSSPLMKMKGFDGMLSSNDVSMINIVKVTTELPLYTDMLEAISGQIEKLRDELVNQEFINDDTKDLSQKRNEFYRKLNEKFSILNKVKQFETHGIRIRIDVNRVEQECLESFEKQNSNICSNAENFMKLFSADHRLARQDYDDFNVNINNLVSFRQEMKLNVSDINEKIERIEKIFFDKIQMWQNTTEKELDIEIITKTLLDMKRVSINLPYFKNRINQRIDDILNRYKNRTSSAMAFAKLGTILNQDKTGVGQSIISEHKSFQGYSLSLFNRKTQQHDIKYVLENLRGDFIDKNRLEKRYDEFHKIYQNLIRQHLKPNIVLEKLISDIKIIAGNIKQKSDLIQWDATVRKRIPDLAAHVFALWTLKNTGHFYEAQGLQDQKDYLLQPHPTQVISIFRMLGIGDNTEELKNNLVQIGTGEGKSVTLGATACILALLGFDVCCVCYSEYLSQRDYTAFLPLFNTLNLLNYIHYGTFNKLCEDIINEDGDIRETVEQLISNGSNDTIQNSRRIKRAKILLIDEVDVFFSREFYGNVYTPSSSLRDPTITSLVNLIWTQRKINPKLNLKKVKTTAEYKACCDRYSTWKALIEEAVKDMLFDVNNFESHDYIVSKDKIGYIEQDNIVYNVVYGYKTLFAYHCEHEKGKISRESLEENICIRIKCGSFSYAQIPLEFKYIMGVTGTLETLNDPEKRIIQTVYKVSKNTFTSSIFGINNLRFQEKDDIMIENSDDYFNVIRREIDNHLIGRLSEKRAVLVFFESKQKLKEFYNSKALESIRESVVNLTEEASLEEKDNLVKRATISGQITLFTRTFGRGTDFICHDQNVLASGGTHVIQTFLSEEVSEEVQIKGRTARQGNQGSYSMVLLDCDLEKFHIEKEHIEYVRKGRGILIRLADMITYRKEYDTVYDLLNDKRIDLFKTQYEANMKYVEQAKERHKIGQKFLQSLNSGDTNSVKKFLVEENKGVEEDWNSRTICLMDATSSMTHLLHKCKNTVDLMFERASKILKDYNIIPDSFQIQFVVYRNYNSREDKILQSSPWETKPDNLRTFMNTIEVEGGWSHEAIEIGLWHANKENERENITQVILIGDAPPNTKDRVTEKRKMFEEKYWENTKFAQPTYYEDELEKLISNKIPVHTFYVETRAKRTFEDIAKRTGGRCELLDINSSKGAEMLTDLVTEEILRNCGGISKGNTLVEAYRKTYGKSYT